MRRAAKVWITAGVLALLSAGAAAAALRLVPDYLPERGAVVGLRIGGATLAPGEDIGAHLAQRARAIEGRLIRVRLREGSAPVSRTLGELGVRVDAGEVVRRAAAIGRRGHLSVRLDELLRARRGEIDVPLAVRVDAERLAAWLVPLKEDLDRAPQPARFDLENRTIVPHRSGDYFDLDGAIAALERAALSGESELDVPRTEVAPRVDAKLLEGTEIDVVVAEFMTFFGATSGRGKNIARAAGKLDGIVLAPGELVSFNEVVGARSEQNGFHRAPEIYKGEMVQGVGGGTCQVSSTLHAAAFSAGLDVVERYPHSRPSDYIGLGLDSTVSWPTVDLKLRNPWTFPIVVHTRIDRGKLSVQLLGKEKPATVTYARDTLAVLPFKRKVTESTWLEPGRVVQKQKGIRGYAIRKTRTIALADGTRRVEVTVDHYPPTPEHFVVPPGTEEAELPPLPEGAAGDETEASASASPQPAASPSG
jgi:vancomycin resistance protein YoaR